jgi:hypothetical protein
VYRRRRSLILVQVLSKSGTTSLLADRTQERVLPGGRGPGLIRAHASGQVSGSPRHSVECPSGPDGQSKVSAHTGHKRTRGLTHYPLDQLQQHSACGSVSLFSQRSILFISPAVSASVSLKRTPCTCTSLFHGFSLLSAADCMRSRLLVGPSCHRLHAECKYGVCWKRERIRRGERNCWPC